jgi:hypothetical protein
MVIEAPLAENQRFVELNEPFTPAFPFGIFARAIQKKGSAKSALPILNRIFATRP